MHRLLRSGPSRLNPHRPRANTYLIGNAQTFRGGIKGTVVDTQGALIAGAPVSAVETSTNVAYKTVASSTGELSFTNLPLGSYTVTVSMSGFATSEYDKIQIAAGSTYTLQAKLGISAEAET